MRRLRTGTFAEVLACGWWQRHRLDDLPYLRHQGTVRRYLPIAGFTLAYTLLNLRRFLGMDWGKAIAVFVVFYAVAGAISFAVPDWLRQASNGTTGYLPPFLALAFFGIWVTASGNRAGWYNLAGSAIFVVSVICRMIDPMVCASFPLGTHFLWHIFNALMLGVLLAATARFGAPKVGQ